MLCLAREQFPQNNQNINPYCLTEWIGGLSDLDQVLPNIYIIMIWYNI